MGRNRQKADKYNLVVLLCRKCHNKVHNPTNEAEQNAQDFLKRVAQQEFEKRYSHQKFMEEFGRNYL